MDKQDSSRIAFSGSLTVAGAEEFHARLLDALAAGTDVVLDCDGAEAVDLSFVQLVLAARAGMAEGRQMVMASPASGPLLEALRRTGLLPEDGRGGSESRFWMKEEA